jgi:CubicO group peptidase (beta-lactamase class C family)
MLKASGAALIAAMLPSGAARQARAAGNGGKMNKQPFAPEGLVRLDETMAAHVGSGEVAGLVALLHRRGETHVLTAGERSLGGPAMTRDTIFRIASLTKPVTAAAAMMLVEDGILGLDNPVDPILPELADRRVLRSIDAPLEDTVPAARPITLRDLLSQRFGLGAIMVWPSEHPIQFAMEERGVAPGPLLFEGTPEEYLRRLGELPLVHQPGDGWLYDTGMTVAGILVARAAGKSLGEVLKERIFDPLGMADTGFFVPPEKIGRLATFYRKDHEAGRLVVFDEAEGGRFSTAPRFEAGNGGLVSTVDDYLAFYRMMLAGGVHDGRRLMSEASVAEMRRDHLTAKQRASAELFLEGEKGWGLGMAVALRETAMGQPPGTFGWNGGYGLDGYTDPENDLIGLLFTQRMMDSPEPPPHFGDFWRAAFGAIG